MIQRKVKGENTMRICSLSVPRLKHEWNQTVWSVNNLRCGTAGGSVVGPFEIQPILTVPGRMLLCEHAEKESKEKALQKEARAET